MNYQQLLQEIRRERRNLSILEQRYRLLSRNTNQLINSALSTTSYSSSESGTFMRITIRAGIEDLKLQQEIDKIRNNITRLSALLHTVENNSNNNGGNNNNSNNNNNNNSNNNNNNNNNDSNNNTNNTARNVIITLFLILFGIIVICFFVLLPLSLVGYTF
jgi:ATP-dependent Zn protease